MRRGYTLIETIVYMAIVSILIAIGVKSIKVSNDFVYDIKIRSTEYLVSNLISFGKHYCYSNEKLGRIEIDADNNKISFLDLSEGHQKRIKKVVKLPKGVKFLANFSISVDSKGVVSADTIVIKDQKGEHHKITISVGIDIINVY